MNEIRAFVGHSFTDDDAGLVSKFLKYFDQLTKLHPNFSWEHAEAAEPALLTEKVLSLIADKNVFIGICTKKERVIEEHALSSVLIRPSFRKAKSTDIHWKTSDWIIQEIGLAKGRGLALVLLIESGLRQPGEFQGDVEYISFERDAPEKSFGKLVEMLTALSPIAPGPSATSADMKATDADLHEQTPRPNDDWMSPRIDWTRADYDHAVFRMIIQKDEVGEAKINEAYMSTPDAKNGDNAATWEARAEYIRLVVGKANSLNKLKELAKAHSDNSDILAYLASGFANFDDHIQAAANYEEAATKTSNKIEAQRLLGRAALEYAHAGLSNRTMETLNRIMENAPSDANEESKLLSIFREIAETLKEADVAIVAMERIVEIAPDDFDSRFSLAYKHSEIGNNDLALFHYLKIPYQHRSQSAWNNLGVSFDHFSLRGKSVRAYQKAQEMGETLAMSNLAHKFISVGFLSQAQDLCDSALAIKDYHINIGHVLVRLKRIPDEENNKETELLAKVSAKSEFYKNLGRAISQHHSSFKIGRWCGPDCDLDVALSGNAFSASGTYERDTDLANALFAGPFRASKGKTHYRVEYSGTLRGRVIVGVVARKREGETPSARGLLGIGDAPTKTLMVLSERGDALQVMENPHGTSSIFYSLKFINP